MNTKFSIIILVSICLVFPARGQANQELKKHLQEIITNKKAQVGIAIIINGKDTITINNDLHYPMMSVFKFHQALSVAKYMEQNKLPLTTPIHIEKNALHPNTYSPLRDKYPEGNINIPVKDLLTYTLQLSDNNACDILFEQIIGVKETDRYIRSLGLENFSISATEDDMHRYPELCYQNWTTPLDAAKLLEIFITKPILTDTYQTFIKRTMIECQTGKDRLVKPLLGTNSIIGHKTGTGDRNKKGQIIGINDIGFVFLPNGQRYSIAVFVTDSEESNECTAQIIADISQAVHHYMVQ